MEDIEDTFSSETLRSFVKGLSKCTFNSEKEYHKSYNEMKVIHKLCPSKPQLRKVYHELLLEKKVDHNPSFLQYTIKRKCRSGSGVTVITILTSPTPEYTNSNNERLKQLFSCGHNCAYCPNEPEIQLSLTIVDVHEKQIKVKTEDDIHLIRLLTYVIKEDQKYSVEKCSHFKTDNFIITFDEFIDKVFQKGDIVTGVKMEQPRSYLSTEPAVLRANRNHFNPVLQIYDRADALNICGHEVDKIEILVLGGTWDHYPLGYQTEFIRDIYFAINTLDTRKYGSKLSLQEEIKEAQRSNKRMIGLTLETRPDCISIKQIKRFREFNVTRLQIGVQHIDDTI